MQHVMHALASISPHPDARSLSIAACFGLIIHDGQLPQQVPHWFPGSVLTVPLRQGMPMRRWPDGSEYFGEWRRGLASGRGIFIYPTGATCYPLLLWVILWLQHLQGASAPFFCACMLRRCVGCARGALRGRVEGRAGAWGGHAGGGGRLHLLWLLGRRPPARRRGEGPALLLQPSLQ